MLFRKPTFCSLLTSIFHLQEHSLFLLTVHCLLLVSLCEEERLAGSHSFRHSFVPEQHRRQKDIQPNFQLVPLLQPHYDLTVTNLLQHAIHNDLYSSLPGDGLHNRDAHQRAALPQNPPQ